MEVVTLEFDCSKAEFNDCDEFICQHKCSLRKFCDQGMVYIEGEAEVDVEPYDPGRMDGPPEKCYPPSGGFATITSLSCGGAEIDLNDLPKGYIEDLSSELYDWLMGAAALDQAEAAYEAKLARLEERFYNRQC